MVRSALSLSLSLSLPFPERLTIFGEPLPPPPWSISPEIEPQPLVRSAQNAERDRVSRCLDTGVPFDRAPRRAFRLTVARLPIRRRRNQ